MVRIPMFSRYECIENQEIGSKKTPPTDVNTRMTLHYHITFTFWDPDESFFAPTTGRLLPGGGGKKYLDVRLEVNGSKVRISGLFHPNIRRLESIYYAFTNFLGHPSM